MGEGAYSITAVRTYVRTYIPYVPNIGFRSLSFEKISLLDSYFIHRYIIIKYRSSSNLGLGVMVPFSIEYILLCPHFRVS